MAASVQGQQLSNYGQDTTNTYSGQAGYGAGDRTGYTAGSESYSYNNAQVPSQAAQYPQYGETAASSR